MGKFSKSTFVQKSMEKISKTIYSRLYDAMEEVCTDYKKFFTKQFLNQTNKTGEAYYNPRMRRMWIRSGSKDEYPSLETGNFLKQLEIYRGSYNDENKFVRVYIHAGANYSAWLNSNRKLFAAAKEDFWSIASEEITLAFKNKNIKMVK